MSGNELPKIIDKTQADIDATIAAIKSCDLPSSTKDFAIFCVRVAVWLRNAMLEQKIRLSNLRKLIFGGENQNHKQQNNKTSISAEQLPSEQASNNQPSAPSVPFESEEVPIINNRASLPGHGRLPHSAYTNTIEHTLAISNLTAGDSCPEYCGGKLYRYEPGILVRIKGQNLAAVHKY